MIRTVIGVGLLIIAILWLPFWIQLIGFIVFVVFAPYKIGLFVASVFADALYAPSLHGVLFIQYTLIAAVLLILHWAISTKTRVGELYAMETK